MGKKKEENSDIRIQFLGANDVVTGSCTHLTFPHGLQLIVDCGLLQDSVKSFEDTQKINSRPFEFDVSQLDYVLLSHSHIDHVGRVPLITKDSNFKGKILATVPTADFAAINIPDCAYLNGEQCTYENERKAKDKRLKTEKVNKLEPLYTRSEAQDCVSRIQGYDFNKEISLDDKVSIIFMPAGHMLGAAMILIKYKLDEYKFKTILFTGDTSGKETKHPFVPVASDIGEVNYIICESTYGDRIHVKNNPMDIMTKCIQETCLERGKTFLIGTFSIQRSSELLWLLRDVYLKQNGKFDNIPIYLDSPMACESQRVMDNNREFWNERDLLKDENLGNLFEWDKVKYIFESKSSKALANGDTKIILSSGGMVQGGRILKHIANFLPSKGCKLLLTGFQGANTLGKRLLEINQKTINVEGKPCRINAKIELMEFSSHADCNQLIELLKTSKKGKLKKVFINHGQISGSKNLQKLVEDNLHVETIVPKSKEIFKI